MTQPALYPLVCLEYQQQRLYAELIQIVEARQTAWLRPWALVEVGELTGAGSINFDHPIHHCVDLRQAPDLLLPRHLIRPALDTELLAVLTQLSSTTTDKPLPAQEQQQLNQLLRSLCQANPQDSD
jgi:hypothetical protein